MPREEVVISITYADPGSHRRKRRRLPEGSAEPAELRRESPGVRRHRTDIQRRCPSAGRGSDHHVTGLGGRQRATAR